MRALAVWCAVGLAVAWPLVAAAQSPFLPSRTPIYIIAGFAGILALCLMLLQPLLAGGYLPGLSGVKGRMVHRWVGAGLLLAVVLHVVGLWITSPPDVVDALLLRSPTPFSVWGVIAMWMVFLAAIGALFRKRLRLSPKLWRRGHTGLAVVIITGTVVHALQIEGAMTPISKWALCALLVVVFLKAMRDLRIWVLRR